MSPLLNFLLDSLLNQENNSDSMEIVKAGGNDYNVWILLIINLCKLNYYSSNNNKLDSTFAQRVIDTFVTKY